MRMPRMVRAALLCALPALLYPLAAYGQCPTYPPRGPRGMVPPTGRVPEPTPNPGPNPGPTPAPNPAPGPTPAPAPAPGPTPAPIPGLPPAAAPTPGPAPSPARAAGAGMTAGRRTGGKSGPGEDHWETWWHYNKDALLDLREIMGRVPVSGSSDFFLGREKRAQATSRPSQKVIETEVLPVLLDALKSPEAELRNAALLALGKLGQGTTPQFLLYFVQDKDRSVREAAVLTLGMMGNREATPALVQLLENGPEAGRLRGREAETRLRATAAIALGLLGDETATRSLLQALNRKEALKDVPVCAAVGLGLLRPRSDEAVQALVAVLTDAKGRDAIVRAHAANALGRIFQDRRGSVAPQVRSALERALTDQEVEVRRSAILALGLCSLPEDPATKLLARTLHDEPDTTARYWAVIALGRIGGETSRKELDEALRRGDPEMRAYAALGLGLLARAGSGDADANRRSLAHVMDTFREEKVPCVRGAQAIALGLASYDGAREPVKQALVSSGEPAFQAFACVALGLLGARDAKETLLEVLRSSRPEVQSEAAIGLGLLGMREAIRDLTPLLHAKGSLWHLGSVSQALGLIGDATAVPPLVEIARNRELPTMTRAFSLVALGMLGERGSLPVLSNVCRDLNYRAQVETLNEVLSSL